MSPNTAMLVAQLMSLYAHWALRLTIYFATATVVVTWVKGEAVPGGLGAGGWLLLCGALWTISVMRNTIRSLDTELQMLHALDKVSKTIGELRAEVEKHNERKD